jgi:hypothetical protein
MEFPNEIKCYILSYLPHPYKKPIHVEAINKTPMFADLTIDRLLTLEECGEDIDNKNDYLWMNSYIEYKKLRNFEFLHRT